MAFLLSLVLLCLLGPLLWAFWPPFGPFLTAVFAPDKFQWVGAGFALCFVLGLAASGVITDFTGTVVHEMTHALFGIPLSGPPAKMEAFSPGDGKTAWDAPAMAAGCLVVAMAPYCFPLLVALFLPLKIFSFARGTGTAQIIDILIGGALAFHYVALGSQLHPKQPDFRDVGYPSAVAIALTSQLACLVIVMGVVAGDSKAIASYFVSAIGAIPHNYAIALEAALRFAPWVRSTLAQLQGTGF
jgi:hypothetical protein